MTIKTLYSVLGLASSAYHEDIEEAFNRVKLQYPKVKRSPAQSTCSSRRLCHFYGNLMV